RRRGGLEEGRLSAPCAACASDQRHVWLQVRDRESRNGASVPMGWKAQRWPSRSWSRPAGSGLDGRHHHAKANERLPWSTFDVRSRQAPCSGSRLCPVLGQTFVRTVTPVSAYRSLPHAHARWSIAAGAQRQSLRSALGCPDPCKG